MTLTDPGLRDLYDLKVFVVRIRWPCFSHDVNAYKVLSESPRMQIRI